MVDVCPKQFIGYRLSRAISLAAMSGNGDWPIEGGMLRQSSWFMDLKQTLDAEHAKIENEDLKRARKRSG